MRFMISHARLPEDSALIARINATAGRLAGKLGRLDERALPISDYQRKYLRDSLLANPRRTWQKYGYLLAWALAGIGRPLGDVIFVDYGGGSGLLAVLAKALGIGTVVYVDSYPISCTDAQAIGEALGYPADHYVHGELAETIAHLRRHGLSCDAIASNNVIEHIYDVEAFLAQLTDLSDGALTAVMATAATPFNPLVRRRFMREQRTAELVDSPPSWGEKDSDDRRAYRALRAEIIARHAPELRPDEVDRLAAATRGLIDVGIRRAVDGYGQTGRLPAPPVHPTNTCDPITGNWSEHLLDFEHLQEVLRKAGFATRLLAGYYATPLSRPKALVAGGLNLVIRHSGCLALVAAPFVTLYAHKDG